MIAPVDVSVVRVVAIGASAGGLEAFGEVFSAMPVDSGLAFVLIQHLDPDHDSLLVELLSESSAIPVVEIKDRMTVEPDHIYVLPPAVDGTIVDGVLHLIPREAGVPHRPIDLFFSSLASDQKSVAVGVVLSGNSQDGASGLREIHEAGGITFAQSPESAKYDAMPRAAASEADLILSPAAIAERLLKLVSRSSGRVEKSAESTSLEFERVIQSLQSKHSIDFAHFKSASVERRILRRVLLGNHDSISDYAALLESDEQAVEILYQDLLIGVTSFFREPERFEALGNLVFPSIFEGQRGKDSVRVWVAGCSTGEEVYSLAIMLFEFLAGRSDPPRITIYGTDINERSLAKARSAVYSAYSLREVSAERLAKYFTEEPGGAYKISKRLREMCVFAAHDITRDPPYSRIDLLTCCNVMIYFDQELQKKAVASLQYALAPGGFLMLGSSENLRGVADHITAVSTKPLIYRKLDGVRPQATLESVARPRAGDSPTASVSPSRTLGDTLERDDDRFLSSLLAPVAVLVNDRMEITRIRGDVSDYISMEPGRVSLEIFGLLRHRELVPILRLAVRASFERGSVEHRDETLVTVGDERRIVSFKVIPCASSPSPTEKDCCWILFHSGEQTHDSSTDAERTEAAGLREALSAAIEDREKLAEDASAAAEEAQSSDEELRSTNEELETAKEELQSANEELSTLNDELQLRNTTLASLNDDIENVLGAVEIPILFVGIDLTVRRFNLAAGTLFNLHSASIGRPLVEGRSIVDVMHLGKLIGAVVGTNTPADVELKDASGAWRLLRIRTYRRFDGKIDGAIVAVLDINELKKSVLVAECAVQASSLLAESGVILAASLDYETTLESFTRLATAWFAVWCTVDLLSDDGSVRHLTASHSNPVLRDLALQFQRTVFAEPDQSPGAAQALQQGKSLLYGDISEWERDAVTPSSKITQLIEALGVKSLISVRMVVRNEVLGTITFASSDRYFDAADLQLAEELGQRAAMAIDTARLFRDAESANRYKDEFLGTVAHELRTPLTSMIGWTQLAKLNPEMREEAIVRVDEGAALLRVFVEDLLDVSRIREQKLSMNMAPANLAEIAKSALDMTALAAQTRAVRVDTHFALDPAPVLGDHVRLLQVVWNLLSNAIKFTPADGRIDVRIVRDGDDLRLSVRDTGAGVSPEFAPHAFELYRQSGDGMVQKGLGIGLSIVAHIVKAHGGVVQLESPGLGLGSTFIVTLPLLLLETAGAEHAKETTA